MRSEWSLSARYFALALIIVFLIFFGYQIRGLFRPLILAGVIAYLFYPLVALTQRKFKLNRKTASNIVYFVSLAVMIVLPVILVPVLARQTSEITVDWQQTLAQAQQYLASPIYIGGIPINIGGMISQYKDSLAQPVLNNSAKRYILYQEHIEKYVVGIDYFRCDLFFYDRMGECPGRIHSDCARSISSRYS